MSICYACVGVGSTWEISVPCPQFCGSPKYFLKYSLLKKNFTLIQQYD